MEDLTIKEILRSKEEKRILTGKISGIEDEYYKLKGENISCAIVWYGEIKVLIPSTHLGIEKVNKSVIRGMLGAEIDFIVIEYDSTSNIAIAMGNGIDVAINISDIIILDSSVNGILEAFKIGRKTFKFIKENLLISLLYNVITIPLAMLGYVIPLIAAIAMSLSSLIVVGNSMRIKSDS